MRLPLLLMVSNAFMSKIGIDLYMLMLLATACLGHLIPARRLAAEVLKDVTCWVVALLFLLNLANLD